MIPSVGDKLWLAYHDTRRTHAGCEVVVTKVARKWATIDHHTDRFDHTNPRWPVDGKGYGSPGRVWPSRKAWEESREVERALQALRRCTHYGDAKDGVTVSDLRECARLLRVLDLFDEEMQRKP